MHRFSRMHLSPEVAISRLDVIDLEALADGRLSVTTACVLAPHLTPESATELLVAAAFRSRLEIVQLLAEPSRPAGVETLALDGPDSVEDSSNLSAPVRIDTHAEPYLSAEGGPKVESLAPAQVHQSRRGQVRLSASGGYEVRLAITDEEHEDLSRAQALLGHAVPSGDPALIYVRAMKHYLAHLEKRRLGVKRAESGLQTSDAHSDSPASAPVNEPRGRGIPKALCRQVWERDGGRCSFVSADGHRCEATRKLEFDHITPVAKGGKTTANNLRLLCRPHDQFEAERVFGKDHIATERELAQRERARARAAASAARAKAKSDAMERKAAKKERSDDIISALRGLGFTVAQPKRGAELGDTMPEASLEVCVRQALTVLTRPMALRGERRARCTA